MNNPLADEGEEQSWEIDLLRLTTAGSVDDGKSTLIGRLLYDTKSIFEDQLEAIERASRQRGDEEVNLALLTDGLRAEREQNITIDVAYRYFATPKRKFIIADTPGHIQYTRNMVTGASTAGLAIVLVDARKGVQTQSRRHGYIASLLGIPHVVVAVNKMDLVDYDRNAFESIMEEYREFAGQVGIRELTFIPISALRGDNVVDRSENMPWYTGATLLEHLETVEVGAEEDHGEFRFPVQYVIRPHQDFRGLAGRLASGTIQPGEPVLVLPGQVETRVRSVETAEGQLDEATAGDSVVITLEDEVDVSRGDLLVRPSQLPTVNAGFDATLCWMDGHPLETGVPYLMMHMTRQVQAYVSEIVYRTDIETLERTPAQTFSLNDIGRVRLVTARPIPFDSYDENRITGSFILIDPHSNATVAAGMILPSGSKEHEESSSAPDAASPNVVWEPWNIRREEREAAYGHQAAVLWFTGLSGSGKSTVARLLEKRLFALGCRTMLLDGDQLRHGLCGDLGFTEADRSENLRRAGEVAHLFFESGAVVLGTFISPYRADRERVRSLFPRGRFFEVHVNADLETCVARDPKGLYARALSGAIRGFTGVDAPYEAPDAPEIRLETDSSDPEVLVDLLVNRLREEGLLPVAAENNLHG
jgi:bifunctional enzyme CysN/CysC